MEALLNAFLAIGLLVVIILIVYLVDRVNSIERETRRVAQSVTSPAKPVNLGPFEGLSGKALWDALSGKPPLDMGVQTLEDIRLRYEVVLHKHIQSLFEEGNKDAQRGLSGEPRNPRTIKTAQGAVESWLPAAQVNTLYKCGMDAVQLTVQEQGSVRAALDEAGQLLFSKVQLTLREPLSVSLLPAVAASDPGTLALGAGTTSPADPA
jgi:hypothetical protein